MKQARNVAILMLIALAIVAVPGAGDAWALAGAVLSLILFALLAYFGPYSNAKKVRETLDLLGRIFLIRSCTGAEPGRRGACAGRSCSPRSSRRRRYSAQPPE